jgi:AraC-like DNA-binding protein
LPALGHGVAISRSAVQSDRRGRQAILDREYASSPTIGRLAERLGASSAVMSRTFRNAYGPPPVRYRHHVRIMDALRGSPPAPRRDVSDVGFED